MPEPVRDVEAYRSVDHRIGTHLFVRLILDRLDQAEFRLVAPEQLDIEVDVAKRRADIGLDPPSGQADRACRLRYRLPGETLLIVTVGIEDLRAEAHHVPPVRVGRDTTDVQTIVGGDDQDRKRTRLNSSH